MSERVARRLLIRGRVQGVWYRESMRMEAEALGVAGWVRNRLDGTVEAHVEGPAGAVDALVRWAWRGPEHAEVADLEVLDALAAGLDGFEKRPTC
jgi:acylphosphatase